MDQFFPKAVTPFKISLILAIVFISFRAQYGAAIRPNLHEEQLLKKIVPNFESLQKAPVPPSDHSDCSNIPRPGHCELNEMNVAGRLTRSPPPFPAGMKQYGAAIRPNLHEEQLLKKIVPNFESLQKAPVPPSDHSDCSNIPRPGHCELTEMNVAGRLTRSPPPFPSGMKQYGAAIRPNLHEEQLLKKIVPNFESLQKAPVPPSDHSDCSNIPRPGHCELNEMNVAGRLTRSPPPFPSGMKQYGAAIRPNLHEEQLLKKIVPNFESLQKAPVPPSDHSGCSNIPRPGHCELNEMNIDGRLTRSPPPFPAGMNVERFAAAATSMENKSDN
ncbi:hypothetical protein CRYUN_Cryun40dG0035100 [Craigia yunnanensis]